MGAALRPKRCKCAQWEEKDKERDEFEQALKTEVRGLRTKLDITEAGPPVSGTSLGGAGWGRVCGCVLWGGGCPAGAAGKLATSEAVVSDLRRQLDHERGVTAMLAKGLAAREQTRGREHHACSSLPFSLHWI